LKLVLFTNRVAADQNLDSDDGLQKALKKLQLAAGIFLHLKDSVVGALQQDPTPDLDPDTLGVLSGKHTLPVLQFFN
jgi:programmed cell death 6-interacting protein